LAKHLTLIKILQKKTFTKHHLHVSVYIVPPNHEEQQNLV